MSLEYHIYANEDDNLRFAVLRDYILGAIISNLDDDTFENTITHLIQAYLSLGDEKEKNISTYKTGKDAEKHMMDIYLSITKDDPNNSNWLWPSPLPYMDNLPVSICHIVAKALAQKHIAERKTFVKYYKGERIKELREFMGGQTIADCYYEVDFPFDCLTDLLGEYEYPNISGWTIEDIERHVLKNRR